MQGRHIIAAGLLGAAAAVGGAASAHADPSASVAGLDGVLFQGCHHQPFRYAIDPDEADGNWSLEVTAFDPKGRQVASSWLWKTDGDAASGRATGSAHGLRICDADGIGAYRLAAQLHVYDEPATDETLPASSFTMRPPASRTRLVVDDPSPAPGQRVRFTVSSRVETRQGFVPGSRHRVVLQRRTPRGWVRLAAVHTDKDGVAVRTLKWKHRRVRTVRAVTLPTMLSTPSQSRALRIR